MMSWTTTTGTTSSFVAFEPYVVVKQVAHVDGEHGMVHLFSNENGDGVVHIISSVFSSLCDLNHTYGFKPCGIKHRRATVKKLLCRDCIASYQMRGGQGAWKWLHDWIMQEAPR
jgi:hypothetical protein